LSPRYVVCEYHPRGNIVDYFAQNVQAQVKSSSDIQGAKNSAPRAECFGSTGILVELSMLVFAMFFS
jgi:hypothetical protein